jgi:hypothetical protein
MTAAEVSALIVETEGRLCARIYRRADGTVLTSDCPVGAAKIPPRRRYRRALALGLILPALAVAGLMARGNFAPDVEPFPSGPGATWDERIDWALVTLGLKTRPRAVMGELPMMTLGRVARIAPPQPVGPAPVPPNEEQP